MSVFTFFIYITLVLAVFLRLKCSFLGFSRIKNLVRYTVVTIVAISERRYPTKIKNCRAFYQAGLRKLLYRLKSDIKTSCVLALKTEYLVT